MSDRARDVVRLAAVGDLHCTVESAGRLRPLFERASAQADVLLLCGDLTDYGLPAEAEVLVAELAGARVPVVAVLGNHDHESGEAEAVMRVLREAGVRVLDGEACEVEGIGIAGVKGFAGGFGRGALGPWGEPVIKQFVQAALDETMKLEKALAKLRTPSRVAMLHYAPIVETVAGEPVEIYPFLGTSRLAEPLLRWKVQAVVHGHAHRGTPEGCLVDGTPVYNVALPLLLRTPATAPGFRVLTLPRDGAGASLPAAAMAGQPEPLPDLVPSVDGVAVDGGFNGA